MTAAKFRRGVSQNELRAEWANRPVEVAAGESNEGDPAAGGGVEGVIVGETQVHVAHRQVVGVGRVVVSRARIDRGNAPPRWLAGPCNR